MDYFGCMSFAKMIEELPSLTLAERRELCRQAIALEPNNSELTFCDALTLEVMQELDRLEESSYAPQTSQG